MCSTMTLLRKPRCQYLETYLCPEPARPGNLRQRKTIGNRRAPERLVRERFHAATWADDGQLRHHVHFTPWRPVRPEPPHAAACSLAASGARTAPTGDWCRAHATVIVTVMATANLTVSLDPA